MDKVVVVTGAGSGIGRELSQYFVQHNWSICLIDIDATAVKETACRISRSPRSSEVLAVNADIRNEAAMEGVFETCLQQFGRLDALVNNAGITDKKHRHLLQLPLETWEDILAVNVTGSFVALTKFALVVANHSGGNIVNITSLLGQPNQVRIGDTAYGVSKLAVEGLTRYAAAELGPYDVNVNSAYPAAMVNSGFFDYLTQEEKEKLKPPSVLNELVYVLSSLEPGELTGTSIGANTWREDPALSGIREKYLPSH